MDGLHPKVGAENGETVLRARPDAVGGILDDKFDGIAHQSVAGGQVVEAQRIVLRIQVGPVDTITRRASPEAVAAVFGHAQQLEVLAKGVAELIATVGPWVAQHLVGREGVQPIGGGHPDLSLVIENHALRAVDLADEVAEGDVLTVDDGQVDAAVETAEPHAALTVAQDAVHTVGRKTCRVVVIMAIPAVADVYTVQAAARPEPALRVVAGCQQGVAPSVQLAQDFQMVVQQVGIVVVVGHKERLRIQPVERAHILAAEVAAGRRQTDALCLRSAGQNTRQSEKGLADPDIALPVLCDIGDVVAHQQRRVFGGEMRHLATFQIEHEQAIAVGGNPDAAVAGLQHRHLLVVVLQSLLTAHQMVNLLTARGVVADMQPVVSV